MRVPRQIADAHHAARVRDRIVSAARRVSPKLPTDVLVDGTRTRVAALRAEVAKLRRQLSAKNRDVAVWRELALREKCCLTALPPELLQYIVDFIDPFAGDVARKALTCKAISVAVRNALKARPFSTEVVTLAGHGVGVIAWRRRRRPRRHRLGAT